MKNPLLAKLKKVYSICMNQPLRHKAILLAAIVLLLIPIVQFFTITIIPPMTLLYIQMANLFLYLLILLGDLVSCSKRLRRLKGKR